MASIRHFMVVGTGERLNRRSGCFEGHPVQVALLRYTVEVVAATEMPPPCRAERERERERDRDREREKWIAEELIMHYPILVHQSSR